MSQQGIPPDHRLMMAAIDCEHFIDEKCIQLFFEPGNPGPNPLNQLRQRLGAALTALAFQPRVGPWLLACFGAEIAADKVERNHRFLEEALELVQALGCTQSEAHQLVDYVFGRPVGEPGQEVGGVMVTLAALCIVHAIDMHAAGETELARIWTMVEKIRAKQAAKPRHSPLPAEPQAQAGLHPATADLVRRFSEALAQKLAAAEQKYGYSDGWTSPDWMDECRTQLLEHVAKGDPRDVAAYCAFLWHHGERTAAAVYAESPLPEQAAEPRVPVVNYKDLLDYCSGQLGYHLGTGEALAFKLGADWFRGQLVATPPTTTAPAAAELAPVHYTPGQWFNAATPDELQRFYLSRLPAVRDAARDHGYAIGLHGSCRRDFDLIAAPWREGASDADTLAHAIAQAACGIDRAGSYDWEQKPAGRIATSIPICWTAWHGQAGTGHLDLSVTPAPAGERVELLKGWKFNHAQQATDDDGAIAGEWQIGWMDEDGNFSSILTVDTGNYFQDDAAEPLARAILSRLGGDARTDGARDGERYRKLRARMSFAWGSGTAPTMTLSKAIPAPNHSKSRGFMSEVFDRSVDDAVDALAAPSAGDDGSATGAAV